MMKIIIYAMHLFIMEKDKHVLGVSICRASKSRHVAADASTARDPVHISTESSLGGFSTLKLIFELFKMDYCLKPSCSIHFS